MKTSLTALTFVLGLAGASLAQDISEMPDNQLLGAVVTATETEDKDRLMDLMREVRARGLLMFRPDEALCDAIVPKVGLLENMLAYGNARQAYIVAARQAAMERGDCACPFDTLNFEAFLSSRTGATSNDIDQNDLEELREYRRANQAQTEEAYRSFRQGVCGKS